MIELQPDSVNSQHPSFQLEVIPENPHDTDPGLVDAVGRDTADALRNDGYTVQPVYTGQRGNFLVEILNFLMVNKDSIDITSAFITISTPIVLVAKHLLKAYEKRVGKDLAQQQPIKITAEIDGALISVETSHFYLQETQKVAKELAQQLRECHPTLMAKVTPQSIVKVKGSMPKRQPQKR